MDEVEDAPTTEDDLGSNGNGDGNGGNGDSQPEGLLPNGWLILLCYVLVLLASLLAYLLAKEPEIVIKIDEGFSVFAVLYIVTQAIERFLEPIASTRLLGADEVERAKADAKRKADALGAKLSPVTGPATEADVEEAAAEKQGADTRLQQLQANRKILLWAVASVLGLGAAVLMNLTLIESIASVTKSGAAAGWFERVDVVITGLAIGGGTKPLHDLIAGLESKKKGADPATQPSV
jgi:hypothetical protein